MTKQIQPTAQNEWIVAQAFQQRILMAQQSKKEQFKRVCEELNIEHINL